MGLIDAGMQYFTNMQNQKFAVEQSNIAYQRNLEQWNRENAYNAPTNQMKLFKEAGLNPNLIYDQSTNAASGASAPVPQSTSVAPQLNIANDLAQVGLLNSQKELIQEQIQNMRANTNKTNTEEQLMGYQLKDAIETFNSKMHPYGSLTYRDEEGHWVTQSNLNYYDMQRYKDDVEFQRLCYQSYLSTDEALHMINYIKNYGTTLDVETLKLYGQQFQINDKQLKILEQEVTRAQMMTTMLKEFDYNIQKLPESLQPLAYLLYFGIFDKVGGKH